MKKLTFRILAVSALLSLFSFTGCNQRGNTLAAIEVTPAVQSMANGTTQQFYATATFTNGMKLTWSQVVVWSSSDPSVATVSNAANTNGLVTAVAKGDCVITAYDAANAISGSARLKVDDPVSLSIIPVKPYMPVGAAHQFSAIAVFSGGTITQAITTFAHWTVSSPGIATVVDTPKVAGNGIVTAGTVTGTTDITATDPISGATGTTTITVSSAPFASITVDPVNPVISLSTGTSQQFSAIGTFADGSPPQSLTATCNWSSSNTGVATIDSTGLASAVAAGSTTITASDPITGISGSTTLTFTM